MANESVVHGKVIAAHWDDRKGAIREVTLEVEHEDGTTTLIVVPFDRMSFRLPAKKKS